MVNKNYYCAIDLGTTNTTLAFGIINPHTDRLEAKCIKLKMKLAEGGIGRNDLVSSCVLIDVNDDGEIIPTVGPYAKHMNSISPQNVVMSTKSHMGTNYEYKIDGKTLTPVDISSFILDFVLNNAKEYFKERPTDLVVTVPASFDSEMRTDTINAAEKVGIKTKNQNGEYRNILLDEPRAALYNFINSLDKGDFPETILDISTPKNILVYDLGGGTLDVSLHKIWRGENNKVEFEDYAISLHTLVGGDNFDELFSEYLYKCIENKIGSITENEKERCMSKLRVLAENAKIDMGEQHFDNQMMDLDNEIEMEITQANIYDNIAIDELISEEEYGQIVESLMGNQYTLDSVKDLEEGKISDTSNIIFPILDVLLKANQKANEQVKVDAVLLNGGMTRLPLIQKRLKEFFNLDPISVQDPDLSVALGAVYYHYNLHNGIRPNTILNDSIGIETVGDHVEHLAKAGVSLPYKSSVKEFAISRQGTTRIDIPFYLGNRNDTMPPNRKIADRSIKYDNNLNDGDTVSIQLEINSGGILITHIWINDDKQNRRIMEVDSNKIYKEEKSSGYILSDSNQKQSLDYNLGKHNEINQIYVDSDENRVEKRILQDLEKFCNQHQKIRNPGTKRQFMNQVKNIETKIKSCSNKIEMRGFLIEEIRTTTQSYFYKSRLCIVLGEICKVTGLSKPIINYSEKEISNLVHRSNISAEHKSYLRSLIEALAKSRDESVEPIFLEALSISPNITKTFINAIIMSLGKVSKSKDTFKEIVKYMKKDKNIKLDALWALGKIGSREQKNPINIRDIEYIIDTFIEIIKSKDNTFILEPYNALYALAEICDRRKQENCISDKKARNVIKAIKDAELKNYTNIVQKQQFNQIKDIALVLIQGDVLTEEQEKCLLDIRSKLKVINQYSKVSV